MNHIAGSKSSLRFLIHLSVVFLVALWAFPTLGLFVSSFRTVDQITLSGYWSSAFKTEQNLILRTAPPKMQSEQDHLFLIEGNLFDKAEGRTILDWGITSRDIAAFKPGDTAELKNGALITVAANGDYQMKNRVPFKGSRGSRVFVSATVLPEFTLSNYDKVLGKSVIKNVVIYSFAALLFFYLLRFLYRKKEGAAASTVPVLGAGGLLVFLVMLFGLSQGDVQGAQSTDDMATAFLSTFTVVIPATIIPILIAAFAAYALAWMEFPSRALIIAFVVGLLVVPLQLALIPLLSLHVGIGIGKGYLGVWLAHTGFGLPLAIYLLRNYMVGLPRDIIESARIDGATDFQIFTKMILPLSFPALASFAIFQFLWTWNDLLVAKVFLIDATGQTTVMTNRIIELLGTRGGNWEILATSAFVSIAVPLFVFFAMQRYLVRGLLAGSVK